MLRANYRNIVSFRQQCPGDEVVFACVLSSLGELAAAAVEAGLAAFPLPDLGISLHQDLETMKVGVGLVS